MGGHVHNYVPKVWGKMYKLFLTERTPMLCPAPKLSALNFDCDTRKEIMRINYFLCSSTQ